MPLPIPYLPHLRNPTVLSMGLAPLNAHTWIEPDDALPRFFGHKQAVRSRLGSRVFRALPASLPAQREASQLLAAHLERDHPGFYRRDGAFLHSAAGAISVEAQSAEPLWAISLAVADDLLLLQQRDDEYLLTAASLCSPSHWRLEDKFEQPLTAIHGDVPGFAHTLQPRVNRFLQHLRPEHPVVRFNWGLQCGDALCVRENGAATGPLHYRCERQSLCRLPNTAAILFTIRVYLCPLAALASVADAIPSLLQAVDACPTELAVYKGFDRIERELASYRSAHG